MSVYTRFASQLLFRVTAVASAVPSAVIPKEILWRRYVDGRNEETRVHRLMQTASFSDVKRA